MSVGDWLTSVSIFFAAWAIYNSSERKLIMLKMKKYEWRSILLLLFVCLYLIKFDDLSSFFTFLRCFTCEWGAKSENLALVLFVINLFYAFYILKNNLSKRLPTVEVIDEYIKLIVENYDEFYKLFFKYEGRFFIEENYEEYERILKNQKFLSEMSCRRPDVFNVFINKLSDSDVKLYFKEALDNENSFFYKDLYRKRKEDLKSLNFEDVFDQFNVGIERFVRLGGLDSIVSWYSSHLALERIKHSTSVYNQHIEEAMDEYELPLYFQIKFISIIYGNAIKNCIDITALEPKKAKRCIYACMIGKIIDNIDKETYKNYSECKFPTIYHDLLYEIFSSISDWIGLLNNDYEKYSKTGLSRLILEVFDASIKELIKGISRDVVSIETVKQLYCMCIFDYYFHKGVNDKFINEINDICLKRINKCHLKPILTYCLNQTVALDWILFNDETFYSGLKEFEKKRLRELLKLSKSVLGEVSSVKQ